MALINFNKLKRGTGKALKDASEWASQAAKNASEWASNATKHVGENVSSAADTVGSSVSGAITKAVDSSTEFAASIVSKLLKGLDIDAVVKATMDYHNQTGKDVTATINFLNKLKSIQDGK